MKLLRSEWTKLRSLRATWLTMIVTIVFGVSVGVLVCAGQAAVDYEPVGWDPTGASLTGMILAQLAIGVLGVLVVTSEYATGMIQPSLTAVPRRGRLLAAKAGVFTAVAIVVGQLTAIPAFLIGQSILAGADVPYATFGQPGVLRAVIGGGLYLAALGLLGMGLGTIMRSTAGAIGLLVTVTLLVRALGQALPETARDWMNRYWPTAAGEKIAAVLQPAGSVGPWQGFAILIGFVAAVGAAGWYLLRTRDA